MPRSYVKIARDEIFQALLLTSCLARDRRRRRHVVHGRPRSRARPSPFTRRRSSSAERRRCRSRSNRRRRSPAPSSTSSRTASPSPLADLKTRSRGRQAGDVSATIGRDGLVNGPATLDRRCRPQDVLRPAHRLQQRDARARRSGSIRRGSPWSRSITSSISAAPSSWCCGRRRKTSRPACRSATRAIRFYPGIGGRHQRSGGARRLLRAPARSGHQRAHHRLRARCRRQRGDHAGRASAVREEVRPVEDSDRSAVSRSRRAGDRVEHAGPEGRHRLSGGAAEGLPRDQRQPAQEEQRLHRRRWRRRASRRCCGPRRSRRWATRRSSRASPIAAPISSTTRRSTSRCTSASISPPCSRRRCTPSNAGVVVHADFLGIYGNCVILDHGLGVQSLYAHLSTIGVKVGDAVTKGQELGRTGIDRASRRRSPALHDAGAGRAGESRRVVGRALAAGPRQPEDH